MTREEIKATIKETIKAYRKNSWKRACGSTTDYEAGQVVGMVKAFKKMGMLEPKDKMVSEIMDEMF